MLWTDNSVNPIQLEPQTGSNLFQPTELVGNNSSTARTIAFVDAHIADAATVMANLQADVKILLDSKQDGIGQITEVLSHYQNLTGIEIVSHGNVGVVELGNNVLSRNSLSQYTPQLQQWHNSLAAGGDILFYGCNVAAGSAGQSFIREIGTLTGADIAASTNITGNSAQGGDWQLEYNTGKIETSNPFASAWANNYQGTLANLFGNQAPANANQTDGTGANGDYELGMEFKSAKAGTLNSVRYYKSPSETGSHIGKIWSSTGTLLGSVTFTNETASGWQQQALATPINIAANTTYVVSVNANSHFAVTGNGLGTTITNGDLSAVADGSNGVYNFNPGAFPTLSNNSNNYFRDVDFTPTAPVVGASVFGNQTPANLNQTDGTGANGDYELGMEFKSAKAGTLNAVRYYKSPSETGSHIGKIWSSTGTLLGSVTFTNETASGWQQQALTTPINIAANATYVVSVNANSHFAVTGNGLGTTITNGDLSAVADGSNGVYNFDPGLFPTLSNNSNNYFRDVIFTPNVNPTNQPGTISVTGTVAQNQVLTANVADANGLAGSNIAYQWQQSTNGTTWNNIAGATSQTLTLGQAQVSNRIRATASYNDALGAAENPIGTATVAVVNVNDVGAINVSGTAALSQVLTANVADVDGLAGVTINYQWQQSTNGTTWTNIAGATNQTLTLGAAQTNNRVRANATYTDALGTAENILSSATNVIAGNGTSASVFTTQIPDSINQSDGVGAAGDYELGMEFTSVKAGQINAVRYYKSPSETGSHIGRIWSSTGTLLGSVTFTNETASGWQQQALATPINIAANTTYVVSVNANSHFAVTQNGLGTTITNGDLRAVADGSNGIYNLDPGQFPSDAATNNNYFRDIVFTPTVAGGSVFTTQLPDTLNQSDGVGADGDYELGMEFTSIKPGQINAIRYYKATSETGSHIGRIWSSTGTLLGSVTFANETASGWQEQALTTPINIGANTTYVVSVNANSHFVVTENGLGTTITNGDLRAVADGSNGIYNLDPGEFPSDAATNNNYFRDIVFTANAQAPNKPGTISVSGTVTQNQVLTANVADLDGLTGITINYQWQQSTNGTTWTNISGATNKTLTLGQNQVNQRVRATATYIDSLGNTENPIGATSVAVVNVNDIGTVILKGSATVGRVLTETVLDADGVGANVNYAWQQSSNGTTWTNIAGATNKSLSLNSAVLGKLVRVRSSYTDALGASENVFSAGTLISAQNAIVLENQKVGTIDWQISEAAFATNNEIAGYGDATSVNKGQALNLKVSLAQAGQYAVDVYRLGYYNGEGGRLITSATGLNGVTQAAPTIDPITRLVECKWNNSYTVQTATSWTSGMYLAKLTDSNTGKQSFVEFTVRDDGRPAELGFQEAATTAAAYNNYGGYSAYTFNSLNGQAAHKVSFDRPLSATTNGLLTWEYQTARWMESQGYDISYYTNLDVQTNPNQLYSQNAFISSGHDEYWSIEMRNNVEKARDNGTNLGFFSANSAYWRVRFEPSTVGAKANRTMAIYKDDWELDPVAQLDNSQATTRFRSTQVNRPENALLGIMYTGDTQDIAGGFDYVVTNAADPYFANTGAVNGDIIPGVVGYEWDAVVNNGSTPAGLVVLSQSPVVPDETAPDLPPGTNTNISNSVRYTAASGAKVFAGGSIQWGWGLDSELSPAPSRRSPLLQKLTTNILADLGAQARTPQIFPAATVPTAKNQGRKPNVALKPFVPQQSSKIIKG